jgi:putative DNA methylase
MTDYKKKLIEVALPLEDINVEAAREKSIRHGHPSTLHLWWARRPLAACRAVLFAQLVDDPEQEGLNLEYLDLIDHFDINCFLFPKGRELEYRKYLYAYGSREGQPLGEWRRDRLFAVIQQLVLWENIQNEGLFELAYKLIFVSCGGNPPAVYDPFSGGGSIPLEAQRLGLEAYGSDLNPVAVMIGKALIEIPPKFAGLPPVNPESRSRSEVETVLNQKTWKGAQGLAEDVRYYGQWMRDQAFEKIGHFYPKVVVPAVSVWREESFPTPAPLSQLGRGAGGEGKSYAENPPIPIAFGGDPHPPAPSPKGREGGQEKVLEGKVYWEITPALRVKMKEVARQFRKEPTLSEGLMWQALRNRKLDGYKFRRQQSIGTFVVDFFCGEKRLVVEVDGLIHESQVEADRQRQELLESLGVRVVRLKSKQVEADLAGCLEMIRATLVAEDPHPPAPSPKGREGGQESIPAPAPLSQLGRGAGGEGKLCAENPTVAVASGEDPHPPAPSPKGREGGQEELTVIAWIWARTVASPNPALGGVHVPLAASFLLSSKKGKEAWIEPIIAEDGKSYTFQVHKSPIPADQIGSIKTGTKSARGANFTCLLSGTPIVGDYIKAEGMAGRMGAKLMAVVAEGKKGRIYLSPTLDMEKVAQSAKPEWHPDGKIPDDRRAMFTPLYGLTDFYHLFTNRQLVALTTFSDLVLEAGEQAYRDAIKAKLKEDDKRLRDGGNGAEAYADAIATYLAFAVDRSANTLCSIARWTPDREQTVTVFARQAVPMTWDFPEVNPFSGAAGDISVSTTSIAKAILKLPSKASGSVKQLDARQIEGGYSNSVVCTDPPYYDNVGYSDLSDFFYVWLRRSLKSIYPNEFSTLTAPKDAELVANPYRHGGKEKAEEFFMEGMTHAMRNIQIQQPSEYPVTIYYAFKQSEDTEKGISSTGWETFLEAVIQAGLSVNGTLPLRTELSNRMRGHDSNALATSVVLVCRKQSSTAQLTTRGDFIKALKRELPKALKTLQHSNIAPVDMAQASIGPGMAIYTRYSKVMEADGSALSVRTALQLINKALDEYLSEQEGDYDVETRFAITWFEQFGISEGDYGTAETLATARNVSVQGVVDAGVLTSKASKVRILRRDELPPDWNPLQDKRLCIWEATQHLIRAYEQTGGETAPAELLNQLNQRNSSIAEASRDLAYRLYAICDRKKWSEEALAYNSLVTAWSDIVIRADEIRKVEPVQLGLLP